MDAIAELFRLRAEVRRLCKELVSTMEAQTVQLTADGDPPGEWAVRDQWRKYDRTSQHLRGALRRLRALERRLEA